MFQNWKADAVWCYLPLPRPGADYSRLCANLSVSIALANHSNVFFSFCCSLQLLIDSSDVLLAPRFFRHCPPRRRAVMMITGSSVIQYQPRLYRILFTSCFRRETSIQIINECLNYEGMLSRRASQCLREPALLCVRFLDFVSE